MPEPEPSPKKTRKSREPVKVPEKVPATVIAGFTGLTPQRVSQMAAEGKLPTPGKKGEFDFRPCVLAVIEDLRERANGFPAQTAKEKFRQAVADADAAEDARDERREKLLPVDWLNEALAEFGSEIKTEVMAADIPAKTKEAVLSKLSKLTPARIFRERKQESRRDAEGE